MVVIDASVIGPLFIPDESENLRDGLLDLLINGDAIVPRHWYLEVANMGLMAIRRKRLDISEFEARLGDFHDFPLAVDDVTSASMSRRVARLARSHRLTMYDAVYLELALRRELPMLTADKELRAAANAEGVDVP